MMMVVHHVGVVMTKTGMTVVIAAAIIITTTTDMIPATDHAVRVIVTAAMTMIAMAMAAVVEMAGAVRAGSATPKVTQKQAATATTIAAIVVPVITVINSILSPGGHGLPDFSSTGVLYVRRRR